MDKFLLMFSGGKDSLATYLNLIESHGKDNVLPFMIQSNVPQLWSTPVDSFVNNCYTHNLLKIHVGNEVYYQKLSDVLNEKNLDTSEYYFSAGENDLMYEMAAYYPVVKLFNMKGLVSPLLNKPKDIMFNYLKRYNCEFVVTYISASDISLAQTEFIGKRLTASELEEIYNNPQITNFYRLQTLAVKCDGVIKSSEEQINQLINDIKGSIDQRILIV